MGFGASELHGVKGFRSWSLRFVGFQNRAAGNEVFVFRRVSGRGYRAYLGPFNYRNERVGEELRDSTPIENPVCQEES